MSETYSSSLNGCVVLVVSHDFPPVRSPQSLRSLAFVGRLAREADEVLVLTRSAPTALAEGLVPSNVRILRASAGLFEDWLDRRSKPHHGAPTPGAGAVGPARLNWKGRTVRLARKLLDQCLFPDGRALWVAPAARMLDDLFRTVRPSVALVMHEPAASLCVGNRLSSLGIPWLADLADPVLAPYTPAQWRRSALRLEASVVTRANAISVTNAGTAALLATRHGIAESSILILPQGFESRVVTQRAVQDDLTLVYTGRFYPFRDPKPLLAAVQATKGVILKVAGPEMPLAVHAAANASPDSIQLLGELNHADALALQSSADVLVSVGNSGTIQTPGKIQEYFGARRPILHLTMDTLDPSPDILESMRRGLTCPSETAAVAAVLQDLAARKRANALDEGFDLGESSVADFEWDGIVSRLSKALGDLVTAGR